MISNNSIARPALYLLFCCAYDRTLDRLATEEDVPLVDKFGPKLVWCVPQTKLKFNDVIGTCVSIFRELGQSFVLGGIRNQKADGKILHYMTEHMLGKIAPFGWHQYISDNHLRRIWIRPVENFDFVRNR